MQADEVQHGPDGVWGLFGEEWLRLDSDDLVAAAPAAAFTESVAEDAHGDDAAKRSDAEEAGREDAEDAHGDDAEARSPEDAEGENEAVDDEMGENEEEGAAVPDPSPPVKRPRGRPKKTVSEVPPVEAGEETRRKRGRPSGSRRSFI